MIYLDNAATTKLDPFVLEAMLPYLREDYGNPGSIHSLGIRARQAVDKAREQVAAYIGCSPEQVIFTSGGSEGNSMVLRQALAGGVVCSAVEHDSIIRQKVWNGNSLMAGFIEVDMDGCLKPEALRRVLEKEYPAVDMVSVMHTNNEIGTVNDIKGLSEVIEDYGIWFHSDYTQAKLSDGPSFRLNEIFGLDYATFSAHKIHGPKGVGAIYAKDKRVGLDGVSPMTPLIAGGEFQEYGFRGGTENVAGIVGFGKACELASQGWEEDHKKLEYLSGLFRYELDYSLTDINHWYNGGNAKSPIISVGFEGVDANSLVLMLSTEGICVSAGSACNGQSDRPSHVLTAIHLTDEEARSTIRVSLSCENEEAEVAEAARTVAECVKELQSMR